MGPISDGTKCRVCKCPFTAANPCIDRKVQWSICRPCYNAYMRNWKASSSNYKEQSKERAKVSIPEYKAKYKRMVFDAYGNACACCGITIEEFLTVEHKNGGGGEHRRKRNFLGVLIDIIRAGFPPDYCLLCMNCNWAKRKGKMCPHEIERRVQQIAAD